MLRPIDTWSQYRISYIASTLNRVISEAMVMKERVARSPILDDGTGLSVNILA